jgi:hypothetical protein
MPWDGNAGERWSATILPTRAAHRHRPRGPSDDRPHERVAFVERAAGDVPEQRAEHREVLLADFPQGIGLQAERHHVRLGHRLRGRGCRRQDVEESHDAPRAHAPVVSRIHESVHDQVHGGHRLAAPSEGTPSRHQDFLCLVGQVP